jgi:hypothetical protein
MAALYVLFKNKVRFLKSVSSYTGRINLNSVSILIN